MNFCVPVVALLLAGGCASQGLRDDGGAEAAAEDPQLQFTATITGYEPARSSGLCPPTPFENCSVHRIRTVRSSLALPCPLIAVSFTDESGHFRSSWNGSILGEEGRRWRITARRSTEPYCHYRLIDASAVRS